MSHSFSLNLPMNRDGSGTAWQPDASPMYGYMVHTKKWMYMFHGNIFVRYNHQDFGKAGSRGGEKWDAPNMIMAMGQTKTGQNGLFHFNVMLSFDAAIAGGSGYPLLFQTGESWKGKPLVDAALQGARLRLRPILMTSFAFILGCVPLWTATGAGSVARQIMGTAVIGGMLAGCAIGIFFIPAIFCLVEKWSGAGKEHVSGALPAAPAPAEGD